MAAQPSGIEPRWPVALAVLAVLILLAALPGRISVFPAWAAYVVGLVVLAPMVTASLTRSRARWLRVERAVTLLFFVVASGGAVGNLANLISAIVGRSREIGGERLLASSIAVWATNVLAFSLLYWQIDRGGPGVRVAGNAPRPDWLFPQDGTQAAGSAPGWCPTFADYLFLAFSTATAFSATDVLPLTSRAKLLMMLESSISLATIVVVASRAINILGS